MPAQAATILVTSNADGVANDGNCTLREAVLAANTNSGTDLCAAGSPTGDVILFTAIAGQTITLTGGQIEVTDGVTISDSGASTTVDANGTGRIFRLSLTSPVEPINIVGLTLRGGSGFLGGAVLVADGQPSVFTGVTFRSNTSAASGGAIRVGSGTHLFTGCTFTGNTTTVGGVTDGGGALYNNGGTVNAGTFTGNTALTSTANGGAILNGFGGTLSVFGTDFESNRAARAGGAIESAATSNVGGSAFEVNTAGVNGGAIHLTGAVTATIGNETMFVQNSAGMEGGALWNSAAGTLDMERVRITSNTAAGPAADQGGGGVFSDGGVTTLTACTITGNSATGAAGSGGGILNTAGGRTTLSGGTVSNNTAVRAGGGIEDAAGALLALTNVTMSGNNAGTAPGNGGAVHVSGAGTVVMTGGTVSGNTAVQGGGLWNSGAGAMTLTETTLRGNTADFGGGLYQQAGTTGTLTVERSLVVANDATTVGGGVLAGGGLLVRVVNSTVSGNTSANGAGVAVTAQGRAALESVTVAMNAATVAGGGLLSPSAGQLSITNTLVADNTAGPSSGAGCDGAATAVGPNIVESNGCSFSGTSSLTADPGLQPLANNGGPTFTHAVAGSSIARGAGQTTLTVDQRNVARATPAHDLRVRARRRSRRGRDARRHRGVRPRRAHSEPGKWNRDAPDHSDRGGRRGALRRARPPRPGALRRHAGRPGLGDGRCRGARARHLRCPHDERHGAGDAADHRRTLM